MHPSLSPPFRALCGGILSCIALATLSACDEDPAADKSARTQGAKAELAPLRTREVRKRPIEPGMLRGFSPLPAHYQKGGLPPRQELVALGRVLFHDPRFSKNGDIACSTCHPLERYGVDARPFSVGHVGQTGKRNAPTVFNAAGHRMQFWDGRQPTVEAQAKEPVLNPLEMALESDDDVVDVLRRVPFYREQFEALFYAESEALSFDNFATAIGAFERTLSTPAPWDAFLRGETGVLSEQAQLGFLTFYEVGCPSCHSGSLIGGSMFEKLGRVRPWPNTKDQGRFELTGGESQKMTFKVASLRNVAETAPYFHDASSPTLADAVRRMAVHQLGLSLSAEQVENIVVFLRSLTGQLSPEMTAVPDLPIGSAATGEGLSVPEVADSPKR